MIKKTILGLLATMALSTLVFGRDACSYLKTIGSSARNAIKSEVPIEFELQRARDMVANLMPDIRQCMHVIAEEEVNVEHLTREVDRCGGELAKQKDEILALRSALGNGGQSFRFAGHSYTSNEVRRDLAQRFERFKTAETTVASKRQILEARQKSVVAAREKLQGMLSSKRDLEVQIENIDARLKTQQAMQTASNVQLDDSQLARAKQLVVELTKQLDVNQKVLDADGHFTGVIPVETGAPPEDLTTQIDEYFQSSSTANEVAHQAAPAL